MNINEISKVNDEIRNCDNINQQQVFCGRLRNNKIPHTMQLFSIPNNNQKILLISESPSEEAVNKDALNNFLNPTFSDVLAGFLIDNAENVERIISSYYKKKGNVLINIYGSVVAQNLKREFDNNFYWTHFCKCYPGKRSEKVDLYRNSICADAFLKKEIQAIGPKLIITVGKPASNWVLGREIQQSISDVVCKKLKDKNNEYNVVCVPHFAANERDKKNLQFYPALKFARERLAELGVSIYKK